MSRRNVLLAAVLAWLLSACQVVTLGVRELNFQPTGELVSVDGPRLLVEQRVPAAQFTSVPEALRRAPVGSVILACWRDTTFSRFWGPCSHVSRKYSESELAESNSVTEGGPGLYPITRLHDRYAVVILDAGVRDEHLEAMRAEVARLQGLPYSLSNEPGHYYCSTYQNQLQRVMGLPDVVPFNKDWEMFVPADVLLQPDLKVLWVGVNDGSTGPDRGEVK